MIIENLRIERSSDESKLIVDLHSETIGDDQLWFSVPNEYSEYLTNDRFDAFLVGMLYPAMMYGEDIEIKGCVSERLLFNINTYVISLLRSFSSEVKHINVIAEDTSSEKLVNTDVGTGFSGGVDSFCTIYDHFTLASNINFRISKLLFFNVGSHGKYKDLSTHKKYQSRFDYLKSFATEVELDFIRLDSNLHKYHVWKHEKTSPLTITAGVLVLQNLFHTYYISSSLSYSEIPKFMRYEINKYMHSYSDPILLPLLSTESLQFIPDGQQYLRSEKIRRIANYNSANKFLNVCVNSNEETSRNCSICSKCMRTISVLESLDLLEQFKNIFDYDLYRRKRFRYMAKLRIDYNKSPFAKDNIDVARANGKYVPSILLSIIFLFPKILINVIRAMLHFTLGKQYKIFTRRIKNWGKKSPQESL
jgi:hypothetical protein